MKTDFNKLTAQRGRAPVHGNTLVAAALSVRCHTRAETLAVTSSAAGARVCQTVHVEPGDIHLHKRKTQRRHFTGQQDWMDRIG